jgi:hypothetical protein
MKIEINTETENPLYNIPTTRDKFIIYSDALALLKEDIADPKKLIGGFCYYINAVSNYKFPRFSIRSSSEASRICYPELFKYEPKVLVYGKRYYTGRNFWFNIYRKQGAKKRIKILETEIELLKAKL